MNINSNDPVKDLNEDDEMHLTEIFRREVVPKLRKLQARIGAISCDFAGERFANWTVHFKESGSDFQIEGFEYDEEACGLELDI